MHQVRLSCLLSVGLNQVQSRKCMDSLETGKIHRKCTDSLGKSTENDWILEENLLGNPWKIHRTPWKNLDSMQKPRQRMDSLDNAWIPCKSLDSLEKPGNIQEKPMDFLWEKSTENCMDSLQKPGKIHSKLHEFRGKTWEKRQKIAWIP